MAIEVAAAKVSVSIDKLQEWEDGTQQPTVKQAENLAKVYKRPFALFFLPDVPYDFTPLQDFRTKDAKELSTGSAFIIREIQQKQAWVRETFEDRRERPLNFVGKFNISSDPHRVAEDILNTLKIDPSIYSQSTPIREWINRAELNGIFISRTSFIHSNLKIDSDELQGFTIADELAPFIFINSDDWDAPQLFTLVHEIAHIWIAQSGISNNTDFKPKIKDRFHPVELFCNEVAAHALMPNQLMRGYDLSIFSSVNNIFKEAKKLGVSSFAFLVRALNLNLITLDQYKTLKQESDDDFHAYLEKEKVKKEKQKSKKSGPSYYQLQLNRNSRLLTQIVLDAFRGGMIQPTQASSLLGTQTNKFSKFEAILYK